MRLLLVRILFETKSDHFSDVLEEFVHGSPLGVAAAQSGHFAHEESVFVLFNHNIELPMGHGRNLLVALPRIKTQEQSPYYLIGNNGVARGMEEAAHGREMLVACSLWDGRRSLWLVACSLWRVGAGPKTACGL
jgi:hypothetical protein